MLVVNMRAWLCLFVASDEEIIFRSWDGDIMKFNTSSNETELLMKNTTFVSFWCFFFLFKLLKCKHALTSKKVFKKQL